MLRRGDEGAAAVEFVALTIVLLVPLIYLVVAVTRVQAGAYAAESASSAAARAAVVAGLDALDAGSADSEARDAAREAAAAAAAAVAEDFAFAAADATVELACEGECLAPGSTVRATVAVAVALPGLPSAVRAMIPAGVTLESTAASPVDGYAP